MDRQLWRGLRLAIGLGVGIGLAGSAFFVAAFPFARDLSNAEIEARARSLGMERLSSLPKAGSANASPPRDRSSEAQPSDAAVQGTGPAAAHQSRSLMAVYVYPDMTFAQIATMLKEAGAIEDLDSFLAGGRERGLTGMVRMGTHILAPNDTPDQILDKLTGLSAP